MTAEPIPNEDRPQEPAEPAVAEPVVALEPAVALEPVVAAPVVAEPVVAEPAVALEPAAAAPIPPLGRQRLAGARDGLKTGLARVGRIVVPIGLFVGGIVLGVTIFGASRPAPAVGGMSEVAHVEAPPVVRELITSLETNDADATRAALGGTAYGLLAGELQEWGYQAVTDVETLGTFVDGTASTTAIVLRGHDATSRPLVINLIVQVERGSIVSFR